MSNNFGYQSALMAGLNFTKDKCDCAVTIDADLQDDHTIIGQMLDKFKQGNEIIYGVRKKEKRTLFLKSSQLSFFIKLCIY